MTERHFRPQHDRGFSLLEVLVALSILALAFGVLMQIFSSAARTSRLAQEYGRALSLAESRMALLGMEPKLSDGSMEGETGDGYRWIVTVEPYSEDSDMNERPAAASRLVTVEISWGEPASARTTSLSTVRLVQ